MRVAQHLNNLKRQRHHNRRTQRRHRHAHTRAVNLAAASEACSPGERRRTHHALSQRGTLFEDLAYRQLSLRARVLYRAIQVCERAEALAAERAAYPRGYRHADADAALTVLDDGPSPLPTNTYVKGNCIFDEAGNFLGYAQEVPSE